MRPTLPLLCLLAAGCLNAIDVHWDGGGGDARWATSANWSGDTAPTAGDTVWFDAAGMPSAVQLDMSYPDTALPLGLVLAAGHDLTLTASPGCELYLGSVTVADAQTYTLRVPRNGTQGASGTMPCAGAVWDIAAGGTLVVREDFGSKALATGVWSKTGEGTLRIGGDPWSTLATPRLGFRAMGGLTEVACLLGAPLNGIAEVAPGATVRFTCYNPFATLMLSGAAVQKAGVTGLAGTLDLGGFDQRFRALSGSETGLVVGNGGIDPVTLTLGVGDLASWIARESDGAFAGSIQDGASGRLRVVIVGGRDGYTQVLSGTSTYTGGTLVSGGRLVLAHAHDTLADTGELTIDGGWVELAGNEDTVGDLTLRSGAITGGGSTLRAATLTVDNALSASVGPRLVVAGAAVKRGAGTLTLSGGLETAEGLSIEQGRVDCQGGTTAGSIFIRDAGLVGGTYGGDVAGHGDLTLSGHITAGGNLWLYMARVRTSGLALDGGLQAVAATFEGGVVEIQGTHDLGSWFGVNAFTGGLAYGAGSKVDWFVDPSVTTGYIDGTGGTERGVVFGAIDVGGVGLAIAAGSILRIHADTGDDFWMNPRTFQVAGLLDGAAITGVFTLQGAEGLAATGWSVRADETGLYLDWEGRPLALAYAPVPETSAIHWCAGLWLLACLARSLRGACREGHPRAS